MTDYVGLPADQVPQLAWSKRRLFLRRCIHCGSWWRFSKTWEVGISTITDKRVWRSLPTFTCARCGYRHEVCGY